MRRSAWLLVVVCAALVLALVLAKPARVRTRRDAVVFPGSRGNDDGPILSEAQDTQDAARDTRDAADDEYEYEDVAEDGPEGRTFHKLKRKLKRKLKPHKWGLGHGGLLGGHGHGGLLGGHGHGHGHGPQFGGWQQPSYGPIAIAGPPSHQYHGGSWHRPPHHHEHQHHGGGWHKPSHFGGGGWNPGYAGPGSSASSWNLGPFSGAFAQSG